MPPDAAWKRPARSSRASVNAPLRWPNSSLSNSVWLTAPKSTDMNTSPARFDCWCSETGHELLADAALAEDQDVRVGRCGAAHEVEHGAHRGRLSDDGLRGAGRRVDELALARAQARDLVARAAKLERRGDGCDELLVLPRLQHEVGGPGLDRVDGRRDVAVGGHQHDDHAGVDLENALEPLEAFRAAVRAAREVHVEQHDVEAGSQQLG